MIVYKVRNRKTGQYKRHCASRRRYWHPYWSDNGTVYQTKAHAVQALNSAKNMGYEAEIVEFDLQEI